VNTKLWTRGLSILLFFSLALIMTGCSGGSSSSQPSSNPLPSIASLSPSSVTAGSQTQSVTITGTNFLSSSTVTFNGKFHTATFVSSTQLTLSLQSSDLTNGGQYAVVVSNPAPGGGSSNSMNFTVNNPVPTLSSVTPSVIAAGAPDTTLTISGSSFVSGSAIDLNGTAITTQFVSATQLTGVVPAADLSSAGTMSVAVNNSSPGGGTSAGSTVNVVAVSSMVILAVPADGASPDPTWLISVAAIDLKGNPIPGLPIALSASAGNLSESQGMTSSTGTFSFQVSAPSSLTSSEVISVSATTGGQTAVAAMTLGSSSTALALERGRGGKLARVAGSSTSTALNAPVSLGVSGPPGYVNPFLTPDNCATAGALTTAPTASCASYFTQNNLKVTPSSFLNMACQTVSAISGFAGLAGCVGFSVSVIACAASETGIGAILCGGALTVGFGETLLEASSCLQYLSGLAAEEFHSTLLTNAIDEFGIVTDPTNPLGYASLICHNLPQTAPPPPSSATGLSTQLVCPQGSTCLVAVNYGSDSVTIYNPDGTTIPTPARAFPGLDGPDSITFDANNGYFYVGNLNTSTIGVYDLYGNPVTNTNFTGLTVPGIEDVTFDAFDNSILANSPQQNQISAFHEDGSPVTLTGTWQDLNQPWGVSVDPANGQMYVSDGGSNLVTVYDPTGQEILPLAGAFSGLYAPDDITFDPRTGNVYVAQSAISSTSSTTCVYSGIGVFDQNGNTLTTTGGFPNLSCPDQIITNGNPESLQLYVTNSVSNSIHIYDGQGNDLTPQSSFLGLNQPTGIAFVQMAPATSGSTGNTVRTRKSSVATKRNAVD